MNRIELLTKLKVVGQALAETNLIPIYQCFCFSGTTVSAFNDTIGIVAPCETKDAFAVNGKVLMGLLENSTAEDISLHTKANEMTLTVGKNVSTLPCFPKSDFLFTEPDIKSPSMALNQNFLDGLSACLLTSSKDLAHPAFMGVYVNQRFEHITLYSSDGDAITSYVLLDHKAPVGPDAMLPNAFCDVVVRVANGNGGKLSADSDWASAILDNEYSVYGRLIQIDTPIDHDAEIKNALKGKIDFISIPQGLNEALSRARVVSDIETKPTSILIDGKGMGLFTETAYGVIEDSVRSEPLPPIEAQVSAELMQRCLKLTSEMTIQPHCCAFREGKKLFILTSNMDG